MIGWILLVISGFMKGIVVIKGIIYIYHVLSLDNFRLLIQFKRLIWVSKATIIHDGCRRSLEALWFMLVWASKFKGTHNKFTNTKSSWEFFRSSNKRRTNAFTHPKQSQQVHERPVEFHDMFQGRFSLTRLSFLTKASNNSLRKRCHRLRSSTGAASTSIVA